LSNPQADVPCSYLYLSGLSYIMGEVSKVILGAAAVLSNGTVLSRAGAALVAMAAAASSTPVLVCAEALKFHERVQLDSITHNELGNPDALALLPQFCRRAAAAVAGNPPSGASLGIRCYKCWAYRSHLSLSLCCNDLNSVQS
jgi:translation initiation factor 2B subunit (eIF-2B alpha/beta/delta family)